MHVEESLNKFGKYVVQQARSNLTRTKHKDTGALYQSLSYRVKQNKRSFEFDILMEDYGDFVDKGVKGVSSSAKAPKSPYRFGTGTGRRGGLTDGINGWVRRKRFQFRKPNGRFMSYEQTANTIIRSIWNKGLETTNFLTKPFERAFDRLPNEIIKSYALDVDEFFDFSRTQ